MKLKELAIYVTLDMAVFGTMLAGGIIIVDYLWKLVSPILAYL